MAIAGVLVLVLLALIALAVTLLLVASGWNAVHGELLRGFRIDPPRPRDLALSLLGIIAPVLLTAAFTGYLALWLIGMIASGG